jgi:hypothetical protein
MSRHWSGTMYESAGTCSRPTPLNSCSSGHLLAIFRPAVAQHRGAIRLPPLAGATVELAAAEVAVGDERAHSKLGGERESLPIMPQGFVERGRLPPGRDVTEQVQRKAAYPG